MKPLRIPIRMQRNTIKRQFAYTFEDVICIEMYAGWGCRSDLNQPEYRGATRISVMPRQHT